jgi:hypothetical protein
MNLSLYGAISELRQIEDILDSEEIETRKNELYEIIISKVDNVTYYTQSLEDTLEAIAKREKELKEAKTMLKNRIERFERYVIEAIQISGMEKLSGKHCSLSIRKPRKKVNVTNQEILDPRFIRTKIIIEPDLVAIKAAIEAGEIVDGAELIDGEVGLNMRIVK